MWLPTLNRWKSLSPPGGRYKARVISFDSRADLAVIKIEPERPLVVMPIGTSSDLLVGEEVIAIGNAYGYENSVTRGIVSQVGRPVEVHEDQAYENLIQTDAAINPGNSGGPLLNLDGELIGLNVAIRAGAQKIGFAIPVDDARRTIARLLNIERLNKNTHGVQIRDVKNGTDRHAIIGSVRPNSPGAIAGLEPGDEILMANDVPVVDAADFERAMLGQPAGTIVNVKIRRDDATSSVEVAVGAVSGNQVAGRSSVAPVGTPSQSLRSQPSTSGSSTTGTDRIWNQLGMRLSEVSRTSPELTGQPYSGGLKVGEIRDASLAARSGIQTGDILIGLHVWETLNISHAEYVITHKDFESFAPLKFYILRDKETLYGFLKDETQVATQ